MGSADQRASTVEVVLVVEEGATGQGAQPSVVCQVVGKGVVVGRWVKVVGCGGWGL